MNERVIPLTVEETGERVDKYATEHSDGITRSQIQKLIEQGCVTVNGRTAKAGQKLAAGDEVSITIPPPPPSGLLPEEIPLKIVYEDNDLIVVDKPAGLTVHPAPGHPSGTLANAIAAHLGHTPEGGESLRPGIVHRLDKDTSGLIIVAKNAAAHAKLSEQFKSRSVTKKYLTLVKGRIQPETGVIEAAIGRDSRDRKRMAVVSELRGREAKTNYRVVEYIGDYSLLEIKPETGRTHQIRVHLAAIGFPVVGDPIYGAPSTQLNRQFLHAAELGFRLPSSGEYVEFKSELPEDLKGELEQVKSQK